VEGNQLVYWEKPPLYFWAAGGAMKVLGPTMLAARLPSALAYLLMIAAVYAAARAWAGRRAGLLAGAMLAVAPEPVALAHIARMDAMLVATMAVMLLAVLRMWGGAALPSRQGEASRSGNGAWAWAVVLGAAAGLGILTKGLVAVVIPGLAVVAVVVLSRRWRPLWALRPLLAIGVCLAVAAPWFLYMHLRYPPGAAYGRGYLYEFFISQHFVRATSGTFGVGRKVPGYLLLILVTGFLPWSIFIPAVLRDRAARLWRERRELPIGLFLLAWTAAPILIFSFSRTQLEAYVGPSFLGLAVLTGAYLARRLEAGGADRLFRFGLWSLTAAGLAAVPAFIVADVVRGGWQAWHAAVAGVLMGIAAAGILLLRRARAPYAHSILLALAFVAVAIAFFFAADPFGIYEGHSTQPAADWIARDMGPEDGLVCYPNTPYSLAWKMWPRRIPCTDSPDDLLGQLVLPRRTFVMIDKGSSIRQINRMLQARGRPPMRELWQRKDFTLLVYTGETIINCGN
jgi:4-amino-4-deoxy-L-arabinose transferase-like glycosyltransferase